MLTSYTVTALCMTISEVFPPAFLLIQSETTNDLNNSSNIVVFIASMDPQVVHVTKTNIVTILPVRTDIYTPTTSTLVSSTLVSSTNTMAIAMAPPVPTCTHLPLPTEFDKPVHGKSWDDRMAILTLVAVIVMGVLLLLGILYQVYLRFRGKCMNCKDMEAQLVKWERGELKNITPMMVQERMRNWDLEKGETGREEKVHEHRARSLASLEAQSVSGWSGMTVGNVQKPLPAHHSTLADNSSPHVITAATDTREFSGGSDTAQATADDTGHPATYSIYLREVIAPREAEAARARQEAEGEFLNKLGDTISDPTIRDSVKQRAIERVNAIVADREDDREAPLSPSSSSVYSQESGYGEETLEPTASQAPGGQLGNGSRFKEHISM